MSLITSPVPEINSPVAAEQVDTTNLLTEIKNLLNGNVDLDNLTARARSLVNPPVVTSLPGSPADGDRVVLRAAEGVMWPLRYNAGSTSPYKWESVGAVVALVSANYTGSTGVNFTSLSSLTPPVSGEYSAFADMELNENDPEGSAALVVRQGSTTILQLSAERKNTPGSHQLSTPRTVTLVGGTVYTLAAYRQFGGSVYRSEWGLLPRRVG